MSLNHPTSHHPTSSRCRFLAAIIALAGTLSLGSLPAAAEPHQYRIDPEHFSIGFLIGHLGYAMQLGNFLEGQGEFVYDEQTRELYSARVEIAADSVFTNHEARDDHLRSSDFLDAGRHPSIRFEGTHFVAHDGSTGTLEGNLTLRGETRQVRLDVTLNKAGTYPFGHGEYTLGISARTTLKRSDWGMTYALEDGLVGDEVELILELEALRQ